jgi:hypothetical protein
MGAKRATGDLVIVVLPLGRDPRAASFPRRAQPPKKAHRDVPTMYHANGKQRGTAGNNGDLQARSEQGKMAVYQGSGFQRTRDPSGGRAVADPQPPRPLAHTDHPHVGQSDQQRAHALRLRAPQGLLDFDRRKTPA